MRSLLQMTLADAPENVHLAQFAHIYEIRSRLVHQGLSDDTGIANAIFTLDILVPALLRSLLLEAVHRD